jgi:hypothetical protein
MYLILEISIYFWYLILTREVNKTQPTRVIGCRKPNPQPDPTRLGRVTRGFNPTRREAYQRDFRRLQSPLEYVTVR